MAPDYKDDLKQAQIKLNSLLATLENLETDIARQKRKVAALAELCSAEDDVVTSVVDLDLGGLTNACITVLRGSRKEWLNTSEVQTALKELGFPISTYKAPNASIATTLNRLVENGYVVKDEKLGAGAVEYKWVGRYVVRSTFTPPSDHKAGKK